MLRVGVRLVCAATTKNSGHHWMCVLARTPCMYVSAPGIGQGGLLPDELAL